MWFGLLFLLLTGPGRWSLDGYGTGQERIAKGVKCLTKSNWIAAIRRAPVLDAAKSSRRAGTPGEVFAAFFNLGCTAFAVQSPILAISRTSL